MTTDNHAFEQANAQMRSIRDMVAALDLDYDRLEELREAAKAQRSISTGTMRPADLVPVFLAELETLDAEEVDALKADIFIPDEALETDGHEFWDTLDAGNVLDALFAAMEDAAPDGCYFAAHPGDGSDYGFWMPEEDAEELAEMEAAAGDCSDRDEARQTIEEDALSVEVRSDWHTPGDDSEPTDFQILLCTGGPAVRIMGELQQGEPSRAWLEYQDWGTPWTERLNHDGDHDALLTYARCFYFGV